MNDETNNLSVFSGSSGFHYISQHLLSVSNGEHGELSIREGDKLKTMTVPLLFQFTQAFSEVTRVRASFPFEPDKLSGHFAHRIDLEWVNFHPVSGSFLTHATSFLICLETIAMDTPQSRSVSRCSRA
ncbi:hypothetical protein SAMN05216386_0998 [Nitrosospira briensis]|uniref:Uncharacterized protein n=1 Tax=Nitrosospira briensis TaxID=35799 RepID=A0A1I4Z2Y1_9PROT|nr:hypothetical protein [Nitrosospira briensis]SFN44547.1 hypothetical protein SAMN05216386_0998 [Nitrosospira briensis]